MKIIHTSDIHLDSPLSTRLSPLAAKERRRELTFSFRKIIEEAENISARAIIISGDLFDNDKVSEKTLDALIGIIENSKEVTFFYLPGNHEKRRLEESGVKLPENLKIFGPDWTYFKLGNVNVIGKSEIKKDMFSSLSLNGDEINIVALHGILTDRTDEPDKIGIRECTPLPIDYLALGHYHTFSDTQLAPGRAAVYSGTPEGRGFDEAGEKGYVLIDTDTGRLSYRFVKSAYRKLHIVNVDITGVQREIEIENRVALSLNEIPKKDIVRVVLCGEHEPTLVRDTAALDARFAKDFFYFEAKDSSKMRISAEDYKNDKSLKGEFIRHVISREELTEEQKEKIIECGIRALAGELS